jgi:hypothetical protein
MVSDTSEGSREQPEYLSYLLRLWRVEGGEQPVWRASLKDVGRGEQVGFDNLEELFDYLRAETEAQRRTPVRLSKTLDESVIEEEYARLEG